MNGELILGYTNGDDAVYASDIFIAANDGVGAWSTRPGGHAAYMPKVLIASVQLTILIDSGRG